MAVVLPSLPNATKRKSVNTIDMQDCLGKIAQSNLNNMHGSTITWARAWILITPMTNIFVFWHENLFQLFHISSHSPWARWPQFRRRYFQMLFRDWFFFCIVIKISLKFVPKGPIKN